MGNFQVKFRDALFSAAVLLIWLGCSSNTPFEAPESEQRLANFSAIQTNVFDQGCALSGCHVGSNPAANLILSADQSYDQLIDVQSVLSPSRKRVEPGSSDESILVLILRGTVQPRMPQGAPPLPDATIDSIALWIDEGALKN